MFIFCGAVESLIGAKYVVIHITFTLAKCQAEVVTVEIMNGGKV